MNAPGMEYPPRQDIFYRDLQPTDFCDVRAAHVQLFPIDYEDAFFEKAVRRLNRILSYGAFDSSSGHEKLVGFVTARTVPLAEVDRMDRRYMGLHHSSLDGLTVVYILTLGVLPEYQKQGIATKLIHWLQQHAESSGATAIFLHVITYNDAAMRLYQKCCFQCIAWMENFYNIRSGRQINPNQTHYDAYLFMKWMGGDLKRQGLWEGAIAPFRHAFSQWNVCLPWLCRQPYSIVGPAVPGYNLQGVQAPSQRHYGQHAGVLYNNPQDNGIFYWLFNRRTH